MTLPLANPPLLIAGTLLLLWWSRKPLRQPGSHGFYRFFAWEAILMLILLNRESSGAQWLSEGLLQVSLLYVLLGFVSLRFFGGQTRRDEQALYGWEQTSALVTRGIFHYIRHPMYAALLGLNWGMFFRSVSWPALLLAIVASIFLWRTARSEEEECIAYFGQHYLDYMQRTRRFIPWLL